MNKLFVCFLSVAMAIIKDFSDLLCAMGTHKNDRLSLSGEVRRVQEKCNI